MKLMRVHTKWSFACCLLVLWLVSAQTAHAVVDWEDSFEYANQAALEAVWASSCVGNGSILFPSTDRAHSGSKSLKKIYRGHQAGPEGPATPGYQSCWIDRDLSSVSRTVWVRYWMYMDNFTVNQIGTKTSAIYSNGIDPVSNGWGSPWFEMMHGTPNLGMNVRPIMLATIDSENVYGGMVPQNQWACIEAQLIEADPGVDNGVMRQWINGTPTLNKTTQRMGRTQDTTLAWQFIREYVQDGMGTIYIDDWAVSRDTRIGCLASSGNGDTAPPSVPTGLSIR